MSMIRLIPVFISSPEDVSAERKAVNDCVRTLDPILTRRFNVSVRTVDWHTFAPIADRLPDRSFQDRILEEIQPESLFVGIFSKKYGSPIGNEGLSGTHQEIRFAAKHRSSIKIMQYFRRIRKDEIEDNDVTDLARIKDVKKEFRDNNLVYQEYSNSSSFRKRIKGDLLDAILELILETEVLRRKSLVDFFRLGRTTNQKIPSVRLVCPQIHKHESGYSGQDYNWQERLLPNVVYEDFRAIDKIRVVLRDIGIHDLIVQPPALLSEGPDGNRIWLCVPRNHLAQAQLEELGERVCFHIVSARGKERIIRWRRKEEEVVVCSPLEKYLRLSRPEPTADDKRSWNLGYGKMYGVDYSIIARFNVGTLGNRSHPDWPFFHYYFAGIRGLGTWGAGWFLDHRYESLSELSLDADNEGTDLQILLRVEYFNYKIIHVEIVSNQPKAFFDEQFSDDYIHAQAEKYRGYLDA